MNAKRHLINLLVVVSLLVSMAWTSEAHGQGFRKWFQKKEAPAPVVFTRMPTLDELLRHLKSNSSKFRQLSSDLRIALDGAPKLRGSMQLELPKRLRIKAGAMGISGVDVGSNDDNFWVWSKIRLPNQRPAIFYANHEQFKYANSAVRQAIPLEPVWLLEGLGLVQFEPTDVHRLDPQLTTEGFLRLVTTRQTPNGPNYRSTLIHPQQGVILQQALYDSKQQRIAYTNSTDYKSFPTQGISLPQRIEMHLFSNGQEATMVIEPSDFKFDSLFGDPNQMWAMPNPDGVPAIDLTR